MKKPTSIIQLLGYILLFIGPLFILFGYLSNIQLLPTTPQSIGDPAVVFFIIGIMSLIVGILFFSITLYFEKRKIRLQDCGIEVEALISKIRQLKFTHWGNQSPYIVYFSYIIKEKKYCGKSMLLWEKPDLNINEQITIFIDENITHHYFADI